MVKHLTCHKCGRPFPIFIIDENGKKLTFNKRKYCLVCSPYKSHNTRRLEDFEENELKCLECDKPLMGNQRKFCCKRCKNISWNSGNNRENTLDYKRKRRREHAKRAKQYMGGKCSSCGFTGETICFDYHHIAKKKAEISKMMTNSWASIKKELDNCIMLCGNCHAMVKRPKKENTHTRHYDKYKKMAVEYLGGKCVECGFNKDVAALAFHHIRGEKKFNINGSNLNRSWAKIQAELDKCELVCINCHRKKHIWKGAC